MLHVDRQGGTWRLLGSVVYIHRQVSSELSSNLAPMQCAPPPPGADHDALHRVPRPHLLQLLRLPQREGQRGPRRQQELQQLRGRSLVGRGQYLSVRYP